MSGKKIIDGLKDAVAGNFSRVTIDGQVWERIDTRAQLSVPAEGKQAGETAYRDAIDEALVVRHLGTAKGDPRKELNDILSWEVAVALDPRVSSAAQALIDSGGAQAGKMIEALEKIAYAPPGGVGPTLRESIEIARAALGEKP